MVCWISVTGEEKKISWTFVNFNILYIFFFFLSFMLNNVLLLIIIFFMLLETMTCLSNLIDLIFYFNLFNCLLMFKT